MTSNQIVVINAGSSSIKFATFDFNESLSKTTHGSIQNIKSAPIFKAMDEQGNILSKEEFSADKDYGFFYELLLAFFSKTDKKPILIGHRVVHGGMQYHSPVIVTPPIIQDLKKLIPFAPLHQPYNIQAIEIIHQSHPEIAQVACFDTAFHRTHPAIADRFALPREFEAQGVHRYGFHGLSYEYIMQKLRELLPDADSLRIIVAHLGNGASMCAIKNGKSIDSTMGFTALDGLVMGTRCGSLDPGVILYLMKFKKMNYDEIEKCLYQQSGLLGVSGISNNMQTLLEDPSAQAKEAVELFVYRIYRELGGLVSVLGGLDVLVFTGGIGEHAAPVRENVCKHLEWLGIKTNTAKNMRNQPVISTAESTIEVRVIPTNEEWIIANHAYQLFQKQGFDTQ